MGGLDYLVRSLTSRPNHLRNILYTRKYTHNTIQYYFREETEKVRFMFGQLEMEGFVETIVIVMGTHQIFTPSLLVRRNIVHIFFT